MYWLWAILLLVLGGGFALLEVFFPSAGLLAFFAGASLVAAVVMGYFQEPRIGIAVLVAEIIGLPVLLVLAFKYWPKTAMGKRVLLTAPEDVLPDDPDRERLKGLIGRVGRAKSKMLLSGVITIDGHSIDAVSESMPFEVGQPGQVVQVRGHRVVVRPIEEDAATAPPADPLQRTYDDPFESPPT